MQHKKLLSLSISTALGLTSSLLLPTTVIAQDAEQAEQGEAVLEEVLVTGSRIVRTDRFAEGGQVVAIDETAIDALSALNVAGVNRDQLERGDVLISPGTIESTYMADVLLMNLADAPPLKNRTKARFHAGTNEIMAHVILLDRDVLEPGGEGPAQIRLTEPAILIPGDRFVLRSLTPVNMAGPTR